MWHYQLSAGPRSKWDCPALLKSQMMRGVLRGLKEAASRIPSPIIPCGVSYWGQACAWQQRHRICCVFADPCHGRGVHVLWNAGCRCPRCRRRCRAAQGRHQRRGAGNLSETSGATSNTPWQASWACSGFFIIWGETSFTVVLEHVFFMIQKEFQQILFGGIPTSRNLT